MTQVTLEFLIFPMDYGEDVTHYDGILLLIRFRYTFFFSGRTFVSVHPPGNFLENPNKATVTMMPGNSNIVNVLYETFKVLNFDGEICQNDEAFSRDDCLYSAIQEVSKVNTKTISIS